MLRRSCVVVSLLGVFATMSFAPRAGAEEATPAAWTPELMLKVRRVAAVKPSADGRRVAYTVADALMTDDRSEFVSQIWLSNVDGGEASQMTFALKSSNNPTWSPDGRYVAFTSDRSGKANLYRMRVDGGEAEQLTEVKSGVGTFAWSPDGSQIAFVMADAVSDEEDKRSKAKDDWRWVNRDPKMERLYVVPVAANGQEKPTPRLLTAGNLTISTAARPGGSSFDWSPDGRSIVFSHRKHSLADDWTNADVSIVDVATGNIRPLAASGAAEFSPLFSPDGKSVALTASDIPPRWAGSYSLQVVPVEGGQPRALPDTFDQQPSLIGWSADGTKLFFSEGRGTLNRLYSVGVETGKFEELYAGNELVRSFELNSARTSFGFVQESPERGPEAYASPCDKFAAKQVSRVNSETRLPPLGKVEVVSWSSSDGQPIEGLLMYPVDYQAGKRTPLLLHIHGGPMGVFTQTYPGSAATYPNAVFASRGYAVLQPNPRGSSGYGKKFRYANYQDWGGGDFKDLMAGVDHLIERGIADPQRLGVMGWSYGGYMTSWTITQTRRFKAASVGAAVTNLVSFTGTADIPGFLPDYFGTQPWDELTLYRSRSPVLNAKGVTTPALVQHGESDVRVPISQGYEFYNALKQQGVPTEMLVLPRQPHGPTEPRMIQKLMQTNLDWFEKYLGAK